MLMLYEFRTLSPVIFASFVFPVLLKSEDSSQRNTIYGKQAVNK
jgi:hypothetical protein